MRNVIFISATILLLGCNHLPANDPEKNNSNSVSEDSILQQEEKEPPTTVKTQDYEKVTIKGDYVRVRDKPDTKNSQVKFKLMTGDECVILEKGPEGEVGKIVDNWYKVDCSGDVGWVWGGLISMKSAQNDKPLSEKEENALKWSEDENAFTMDLDLVIKMQKSLTDFYTQCSKDPQCKIREQPLENAFDSDNTVVIASTIFKNSSIKYVEDGSWPFEAEIVDEEISLGPGIKAGLPVAGLEKIVGKPVKAKIYRIQGESDEFYIWIENGIITKIEYAGYTG